MFYAHIILAKKGPLARIWLAAHWDKKLTKAHVFETNIEKSVEGIMQPKVKLALRTSGHLLLGVVRIYSRKAKYLLADCNEAFVKIKMAFRPGMVDLPEGHREANVNAITLPEVFHDFDTALPELNDIDLEAQFSINQSRADEITMREDYGSLPLSIHDDGFGDLGFEADAPDLMRGSISSGINDQLFEDEVIPNIADENETTIRLSDGDILNSRLDGDGFGDEFGQPELFEDDLFGESTLKTDVNKLVTIENGADDDGDEHNDNFETLAPSPMSSVPGSPHVMENRAETNRDDSVENVVDTIGGNLEQSTLLQNEDESFALAPVDASAYKGITKTKRKRKLIVDEIKNISGEEMKAQLANTSDIITTLDLAPPTKRLMYWKETGGVEKLFSLPSRSIPARGLFINYHRRLISHFTQLEDFSSLGPNDLLAIETYHTENESLINNNKRGRKRKQELLPFSCQVIENTLDVAAQSLPIPDVMRDNENQAFQSNLSIMGVIKNPDSNTFSVTEQNESEINEIHAHNNTSNIIPLSSSVIDGENIGDDNDEHESSLHHCESMEMLPQIANDIYNSGSESKIIDTSTEDIMRNSENASDWLDYDFPPSIGAQNATDEQMENETNEQFEERVLNKRAAQLFYTVKNRMVKQDTLFLSEMTVRNTRKQAAQKFYSLLVLKKFRALNIDQTSAYEDISIRRGPLFENPKL